MQRLLCGEMGEVFSGVQERLLRLRQAAGAPGGGGKSKEGRNQADIRQEPRDIRAGADCRDNPEERREGVVQEDESADGRDGAEIHTQQAPDA